MSFDRDQQRKQHRKQGVEAEGNRAKEKIYPIGLSGQIGPATPMNAWT
jgi:hypothetical protein